MDDDGKLNLAEAGGAFDHARFRNAEQSGNNRQRFIQSADRATAIVRTLRGCIAFSRPR